TAGPDRRVPALALPVRLRGGHLHGGCAIAAWSTATSSAAPTSSSRSCALGGSLQGRRVLDLECNAGLWSLLALQAGAEFVLGTAGRRMFIEQAEFVFEAK